MTDRDPFDELDDAADREGDPFQRLPSHGDEAGDDEETEDETEASDADDGDAEDSHSVTDAGPSDSSRTRAGDANDRASRSGRGRRRPGKREGDRPDVESLPDPEDLEAAESLSPIEGTEEDPFEDAASAFEHVDVGTVDPDEVWERLQEAREAGSVAEAGERVERVVSKQSFCQQCEHFSEPPDIACSHEGTDIVTFPDIENVVVLDCPVVAEREELERLE